MALNYADREAIRPLIVPRCTGIALNYAIYLMNLPSATDAQKAWAAVASTNPDQFGREASYHVTREVNFAGDENTEAAGSGISDANLLTAVEAALNTHVIPRYAPGA